jgi:hypothetical protein
VTAPDAGSLDPVSTGVGGHRMGWAEAPERLRTAVARALGSEVVSAEDQLPGFSPGPAARLGLADGRAVFVKAAGPDQAGGQALVLHRREAAVARLLPPSAPAPRLLATVEEDGWLALAFEAVAGRPPHLPWRPAELGRMLAAVADLARELTPAPPGLRPAADLAHEFRGWRDLLGRPADLDRLAGAPRWLGGALEALAAEEDGWAAAVVGDTLLHGDLRADNTLLTEDAVVFVDWPHAFAGAAFCDLAFLLPSLAMQGAGDPAALFAAHPLSEGVGPGQLRAVVAAVAGFFCSRATLPPPPGLPTLRRFQWLQAEAVLPWLAALLA